MDDVFHFYRKVYRIRLFEETVLNGFSQGIFCGTTHTCLGQEANAVGVISALKEDDIVLSNHRCHGHFLAYGGDITALFAELMGKSEGICEGWAGSQHLHWKNFYANGIQGGMIPCAVGMAYAEKMLGKPTVVAAFLGDGTLGEGVVYESFNLASLWNLPLLFVLEDNRIAQTTPTKWSIAGSMRKRFEAFDILVTELDTCDVMKIYENAVKLVEQVRSKNQPHGLILHTYRLGPHSKGDDTRSKQELEFIMTNHDCIKILADRVDEDSRQRIEKEVQEEIEQAFERAKNSIEPMLIA